MKKDELTTPREQIYIGIKRALKQGAIGALGAGGIGFIYGLVRNLDPFGGAIRLIYILGVLMILLALFSAPALFQLFEGRKQTYSKEEVQLSMKERREKMRRQWVAYLRAFVVLAIAALLETLKFYVF